MDQNMLSLLKEKYPTPEAVYTELINLEAIQNLPKGTELYISDIHGASEAFEHILRTGAGNVREKLENYYGDKWTQEKKDWFSLLIGYPEYAMKDPRFDNQRTSSGYSKTIMSLVEFMRFCSVKYTRSKVRKALPENYLYIIEELLYTDLNQHEKDLYYKNILKRLVELGQAETFIASMCYVIQRLVIDHLHLVGDIFDRSSGEDRVMDRIMSYHSLDIQWGNHDLLWMGARFGSKTNLMTLLRIAARYGYLFELEKIYGLNLRPLFLYAEEHYESHDAFKPKCTDDSSSLKEEGEDLLAKAHQALAIIQFKLEEQLIKRRPEFNLSKRLILEKIDINNRTVMIEGQKWALNEFPYDQIDPDQPDRLFAQEEYIVYTLLDSFQRSEKIKTYVQFLLDKGSMYLVYNHHLLFHGCMPLKETGEWDELTLEGKSRSGKDLLDAFETYIRVSAETPQNTDDFATDLMWYAWAGDKSPLFGRNKMTTFERYYIKDRQTHIEERNPYFILRNDAEVVSKILHEFGLKKTHSRIINGHTPIKVRKGERPVKAGGKLIVIDGGMNEAYQKTTGIAGYSLLNNSYGFQIVTHQPFRSVDHLFEQGKDKTTLKHMIDGKLDRKLIRQTTIGQRLQEQIDLLLEVVRHIQSERN